MPVMIKNNQSVLFVHIPKCGGSSFEKIMSTLGWKELLSIRGLPLNKLNFINCTPQHMHKELLSQIIKPQSFDQITTIVRNPYNRLLSEYAWQTHQKITRLPAKDWIDHVFNEYEKNKFSYDNHIRPQSEFIFEDSKIFKLEENGILNAIMNVNPGIDPKDIPNKSEKRTKKNEETLIDFEDNKKTIIAFYKQDYKKLNYSFD